MAEAYDDPARRGLITNEMAVAKHTVTNMAIDIVDKAMRVVGAKSLQLSNPLQRFTAMFVQGFIIHRWMI